MSSGSNCFRKLITQLKSIRIEFRLKHLFAIGTSQKHVCVSPLNILPLNQKTHSAWKRRGEVNHIPAYSIRDRVMHRSLSCLVNLSMHNGHPLSLLAVVQSMRHSRIYSLRGHLIVLSDNNTSFLNTSLIDLILFLQPVVQGWVTVLASCWCLPRSSKTLRP